MFNVLYECTGADAGAFAGADAGAFAGADAGAFAGAGAVRSLHCAVCRVQCAA